MFESKLKKKMLQYSVSSKHSHNLFFHSVGTPHTHYSGPDSLTAAQEATLNMPMCFPQKPTFYEPTSGLGHICYYAGPASLEPKLTFETLGLMQEPLVRRYLFLSCREFVEFTGFLTLTLTYEQN